MVTVVHGAPGSAPEALGTHRLRAVKEDAYFVVMADPEGNEFCID